MRFRTKFQGVQFASAAVWIGLSCAWLHKPNADLAIRGAYLIAGVIWLFVGIISLASYFLTWWEIDDAGLTQRRLWSKRIVPWSEVSRVGPWQPGRKPMPNWLAVDYARSAPMSDRGG